MRMNHSGQLDASQVINEYPFEDLRSILSQYGELRNAHKLATAIIKKEKKLL